MLDEDFEDDEPNKAPIKGMPDMDLSGRGRSVAKCVDVGALKRPRLETE